ncbi:hypothetical protein ES703_80123 [subsurface metagenome]
MHHKKGFTLIELLVVVAIIGLLTTIVLVNMRDARAKARDASIQSYMHQVRNAAEMSYIRNNENYAQVCDEGNDTLSDDGEFGVLEDKIEKDNGNKTVKCIESVDKGSFAVSSPMVARTGKHWCIESAGLSREIDGEITSAICE